MSAAVLNYKREKAQEKSHPMKFLEQLKLQAFRRFQEETSLYDSELDDHVGALEALVEKSKDGMVVIAGATLLGRDAKIQYLNPAFSKMTGYTAEELVGKSAAVLQRISGELGRFENPKDAIACADSSSIEVELTRRGGPNTWAELSITPVENDDESISRWIYVLRDVSEKNLAKRLESQLKQVQAENGHLVTDLERQKTIEYDLMHSAFFDSLTGLRNRRYFLDRLTESLQRSKTRPGYRAAVLYLDLDGFKAVNDTFGHRGGDRVLIETSRRLEKCCRTQDTIARLGGDEFAILIDDVTPEAGSVVVRRILESLTTPFDVGGEFRTVAPSLGYCAVQASFPDVEDILRDADAAMYRAKRKGGARCVYSDASLDASMTEAARYERELQHAIQSAELKVYYQPVLDTLTTPPKLWGVEAMVRWQHPGRGLLLPAEFLPMAEHDGLAVSLGLSVFRTACLQMKRWQSRVLNPDFFLSVNMSSAQIDHPSFFQDFVDILADTEIDPRCLQVEVSEESLAQHQEKGLEAIERIRALGVKIALDRFGTGRSSMTRLESYPIDSLKIDGSLIKRLGGSPKDSQLPKLIVEFARALEIKPIAGQVENEEEIKSLRQAGCTLVQGNVFSAAVDESKITRLLEQGTRSLTSAKTA